MKINNTSIKKVNKVKNASAKEIKKDEFPNIKMQPPKTNSKLDIKA